MDLDIINIDPSYGRTEYSPTGVLVYLTIIILESPPMNAPDVSGSAKAEAPSSGLNDEGPDYAL